jgi:hypothetical protein
MIEQRLDAGEALQSHEFFAVELAIGLPELRVPLVGDLPKPMIERHTTSLGGYL